MKARLIPFVFVLLFSPAAAQQNIGMAGSAAPYPEHQPTTGPDTTAVNGDRHDLDGRAGPEKPHMSSAVSAILKDLLAAAGKKDWATAKAKLGEVQAVAKPTEFDLFEIEVIAGFVALNTADHPGALASYKKVIANPLFKTAQTRKEQDGTLRNAMVLANEAGDFQSAIAFGGKLAAMGPLDETGATTLAVAYFGAKDYASALGLAQKVVDTDVAAGQVPSKTATDVVTQSKAAMH